MSSRTYTLVDRVTGRMLRQVGVDASGRVAESLTDEERARGVVRYPSALPDLALVYFGFVPGEAPSDSQVAALSSAPRAGAAGDYVLTQDGTTARFPCIAFPAAFAVSPPFRTLTFTYLLVETAASIGGVAFRVFTAPTATFVPSLSIEVQ